MNMTTVATAAVEIVPTMQGAQQTITKEMTGAASGAGLAAGKALGSTTISSMGDSMSKAGSSLTKKVTLPLAAIGVAATAAWKEVDAGLDTIAIKTGASGTQLDAMGDSMKSIARSIPSDFETIGSAIGEVNTRFGVTGQELEDLSTQFIKFAKLNNQDVSSAVDSTSKIIAAFGMDVKDAGSMLDALNVVGQQTGVDVGRLSDLVNQNAASLRDMGLNAYDAASFLGAADMAGIEATTMMTGLRTAMKNAAKDGTTLDDALAVFTDTMTNNASESDKLAAAYELFGTRAGGAIYNAVSNGTLDLQNFSSSLGEFEGSVSSTFSETLDPMDQFTTVLNNLKIAGAELITAAGPALVDILGSVSNVVTKVADAWSNLSPEMQDVIVKVALVAAAAGPVLSIGGKIVGGIGKIKSGIGGLTGTLGSFSSSAGTAASAAGSAGSSFSSLGGKALLLVAAGAAVLMIAAGMAVMAQAAIALWQAGPGAIATFVGIAAVAVGLTAAIVAIGSAATVSAVGLLALGAAVLMISIGMAVLVLSVTLFCTQLPVIAEYGLQAAVNILALAGAMALMAAATVLLGAALLLAIIPLTLCVLEFALVSAEAILLTVALAALAVTTALCAVALVALVIPLTLMTVEMVILAVSCALFVVELALIAAGALLCTVTLTALSVVVGLSTVAFAAGAVAIAAYAGALLLMMAGAIAGAAGVLLLEVALVAVAATTSSISSNASKAATSLMQMVTAVSVVSSLLDGLGSLAKDFVQNFLSIFSSSAGSGQSAGKTFGTSVVTGVKTGLQPLDQEASSKVSAALKSIQLQNTTAQASGKQIAQAFADALNVLPNKITEIMNRAQTIMNAALASLQNAVASTQFRFNTYIPLPHFTMQGEFNAKNGTVPTVGVNWYAQAATQGALFTDPMIIGVGDASQPELLIGQNTLRDMLSGETIINITNNIDGAENPEEFASRLVRQIKLEMRMA